MAVLAAAWSCSPAQAEDLTRVRFTLDWVVQGQHAHFFQTAAQGYFRQEGLDVTLDAGGGSGAAIQRVATTYDMGYADLGALIEAQGNDAGAKKVRGVYLVYEKSPNALLVPRRAGVKSPADLKGKRLGAPTTSPVFKLWPLFARANGLAVDDVSWVHVAPNLVEATVMQGNADIGTGHPTQAVIFYQLGLRPEDLQILKYADYGVTMYGHAIVVNTDFAKKNPKAVAAFLRAFNRGLKDTLADPAAAVHAVAQASPLLVEKDELMKLRLMLDLIDTPNTRADGLGAIRKPTLEKMTGNMLEIFKLKARPDTDDLFDASFLPPKAERMIAQP
jgi:NitT/TauT family transport system substrate-binding protein